MLGVARAAIDTLKAMAMSKVYVGGSAPLCEAPGVQADVARAEVQLRAARAFMFETVGSIWETALAGGTATDQQRALTRMACWNAAQAAKQTVELMYFTAVGSAVDDSGPLAAQMRDIHAAAQHANFANRHMEAAGCILLGMDPGPLRF
jgi:alkylation response protein AidB-like acyl-CoA dehydrogenase